MNKTCEQCPWRISNQGRKHKRGFYTKRNLTRLWNQIRRGGRAQSCHLTDPKHKDHIEAGCADGAKAKECPGSVVIILRELQRLAPNGNVGPEQCDAYLIKRRRHGLTKQGILYWAMSRIQFGGVPFMGGPKLPEVDEHDPDVGLPAYLIEG